MTVNFRIEERPAFMIIGKKTWIAGQDNAIFGRFWEQCTAEGLMTQLGKISGLRPGAQTKGATLGISRVEEDPARREFNYMIAVEIPPEATIDSGDLESYLVPASTWAIFECRGKVPESIVRSEIFAFSEWLPGSGYVHALAPEMEVYPDSSSPNDDQNYCEFWLPVKKN